MAEPVIYVPVLTGKLGEFAALRGLADDVGQAIWPILDVPPVHANANVDRILDRLAGGIGGSISPGHAAVDLLALENRSGPGTDHFAYLIERACWNGTTVQLAVRTDASEVYVEKVAEALPGADGLCIRACIAESTDPSSVAAAVDKLLAATSATPPDTHLVFDCGHVADWVRGPHLVVAEHLDARADLAKFKLVSMAATTVPQVIEREDPPMPVQRREWTSWRRLSNRGIAFADYGITGPRSTRPPEGRPDPHLRYTTDNVLLIWRGRAPDRATGEDGDVAISFRELCELLVREDEVFAGADYSDGDRVLAEIAAGNRSTDGNATGWVEWATSHHLTHVVRQLQGA